jgi:dipeptidyl aminopeptidase/acylaminoacyl peptidase
MDDPAVPTWERRFRAPIASLPHWSPNAPDRLVYASTESGVWQVHAWDRATGMRRQVTDHPVGITHGGPTLDGEGVLWFQDETGDESGRWMVQPFHGGEATPFLDGVPLGWPGGLAQAPGIVAAGFADASGAAIFVSLDGGPAKEVYRGTDYVALAGAESNGFNRLALSSDGALLCLQHCEHGDLIHPALKVIDPRTGAVVGEQVDEGMALEVGPWSPVPGDHRLAITHERHGEARPALWDLDAGTRVDLPLDGLTGMVEVKDWWPDGSALLLNRLHEGRDELYRFDLSSGTVTEIPVEPGTAFDARVRGDGRVWETRSSSAHAQRILDDTGQEVFRPKGESAPDGRPYESWHFENEHGQVVHGFYATPEGTGPWPVMMSVHGGPTGLDMDAFDPETQAFVDAGFAVGLVNYRGSSGYGREWRDAVIGDIGRPELEDVNAGLADLIARGIADPARAVVGGWSWGGYVTLMELGTNPDPWTCGVAGIPVGDYAAGYEDLSPILQAYDRALLGGTPQEVPELMATRSPIVFADDVRVPVLFLIGENDSRCPLRQAMSYVDKLAARGHPHQVYLFATGHGSRDVEERIRQTRVILAFLAEHVTAA